MEEDCQARAAIGLPELRESRVRSTCCRKNHDLCSYRFRRFMPSPMKTTMNTLNRRADGQRGFHPLELGPRTRSRTRHRTYACLLRAPSGLVFHGRP